jgi:2-polyprenyl-6-methoxyphenol hydroxylase-like FAD-dependent oxidoreductase
MGYFGNAFSSNRGMGQRGNLRIPRQVLRQILMEQLESKIPVEFGKRLVGFDAEDETVSKSSSNQASPQLALRFEDGSTETGVDLLIGADGIRSSVVKHLLPNSQAGLNYLGIFIILGIAEFSHPHLDERGFYTLDGNHRLFTMPYEGSRLSNSNNRRIMWQLSYRLESHEEALRLSKAGPKVLQEEVLKRCEAWHDPVVKMVQSTPHETIWGT